MSSLSYNELKDKRVLVIDDSPTMRAMLRQTAQGMGVGVVDTSESINDALFKLVRQERVYDIILCDYILGDGRDGQQFLEELRHRKLLPYHTVFIMVTAERGYERVVSAVELSPDDYLIKPFTSGLLMERTMEQLTKKKTLATLVTHMADGEFSRAVEEADRLLRIRVKYKFEALRLKAEALLNLHQVEDALAVYRSILAENKLPWARYGLAKAEYLQNKLLEAKNLLESLITDHPQYTAAYDLLAEVSHDLDDVAGVQAALVKGVAHSPRNLQRNRKLGEAYLLLNDHESAAKSLSAVINHGANSALLEPRDFVNRARCALVLGDAKGASECMDTGLKRFSANKDMQLAERFIESKSAVLAGNMDEAKKLSLEGLSLMEEREADPESTEVPPDIAIAGMESCLATGLHEEAANVAVSLFSNQQKAHGAVKPSFLTAVESMFKQAGADTAIATAIQAVVDEKANLNNRAVSLANEGNYREAISLFSQAAAGKSATLTAMLNAAKAMLMVLEKEGWEDDLAKSAVHMLNRAKTKDPAHASLPVLTTKLEGLRTKYGIAKNHSKLAAAKK